MQSGNKSTIKYRQEPRLTDVADYSESIETKMAIIAYRKLLRHIELSTLQPRLYSIKYSVENGSLVAYLAGHDIKSPIKVNVDNIMTHTNGRFETVLQGLDDWNNDVTRMARLQQKLASEPEYVIKPMSSSILMENTIEIGFTIEGYSFQVRAHYDLHQIITGIIPWSHLPNEMSRMTDDIHDTFENGKIANDVLKEGKRIYEMTEEQKLAFCKMRHLNNNVLKFMHDNGYAKKSISPWHLQYCSNEQDQFMRYTASFWSSDDACSLLNDFIWCYPQRAHQYINQPDNISLLLIEAIAITKFLMMTKKTTLIESQEEKRPSNRYIERAEGEFNENYGEGVVIDARMFRSFSMKSPWSFHGVAGDRFMACHYLLTMECEDHHDYQAGPVTHTFMHGYEREMLLEPSICIKVKKLEEIRDYQGNAHTKVSIEVYKKPELTIENNFPIDEEVMQLFWGISSSEYKNSLTAVNDTALELKTVSSGSLNNARSTIYTNQPKPTNVQNNHPFWSQASSSVINANEEMPDPGVSNDCCSCSLM